MKTITKVLAKNMELQLVEVQNVKKEDWKGKPDVVWTTYEIQKNGIMIAGGGLEGLQVEYARQLNFAMKK